MKNKSFLLIIFCTLLSSCTEPSINDHEEKVPTFNFKKFFTGKVTGHGFIENWRGEIESTFIVKFNGTLVDSKLIITEEFAYDTGEKDERIVEVEILDNGRYKAISQDFNEDAKGFELGNAALFNYNLKLKQNKIINNVSVNEQMVLFEDGTVVANSKLKKLGMKVGKVVILLKKKKL